MGTPEGQCGKPHLGYLAFLPEDRAGPCSREPGKQQVAMCILQGAGAHVAFLWRRAGNRHEAPAIGYRGAGSRP